MIKSYISAIKAVLKMNRIKIHADMYALSSLTRACRLINYRVRVHLPIHKGVLKLILQEVSSLFSEQPYLSILYKAQLVTAYYGLFRVGKIAASSHTVKACDVHIATNKKKIMFLLRTSKMHGKESPPQLIKIIATDTQGQYRASPLNVTFCPFALLNKYLSVRQSYKSMQESFFIFRDKMPVTPYNVHTILKTTLTNAGLNSQAYSTHGFRIGRSGDLLNLGISVEMIKKLGRWKSNAVFKYLHY